MRIIKIVHVSNTNKRVLLHHLLLHQHLRTNVSTMVRVLELNLFIHMVVWRKVVESLLPTSSVVGTTLVFLVRALPVVLCVVRPGISCKSVQRISMEIVMGAIELVFFNFSTRDGCT